MSAAPRHSEENEWAVLFCCPVVDLLGSVVSRAIASSEEMKDYDRVCVYVDNQFKAEDNFTVWSTQTFSQSE